MSDQPVRSGPVSVTRSEEQATIDRVWRPYERVRLTKRTVTERRTVEVDVRREELVVERLEVVGDVGPGSAVPPVPGGPLTYLLREERLEITRTMEPYERVTVRVEPVEAAVDVTVALAKERVVTEEDRTGR